MGITECIFLEIGFRMIPNRIAQFKIGSTFAVHDILDVMMVFNHGSVTLFDNSLFHTFPAAGLPGRN